MLLRCCGPSHQWIDRGTIVDQENANWLVHLSCRNDILCNSWSDDCLTWNSLMPSMTKLQFSRKVNVFPGPSFQLSKLHIGHLRPHCLSSQSIYILEYFPIKKISDIQRYCSVSQSRSDNRSMGVHSGTLHTPISGTMQVSSQIILY